MGASIYWINGPIPGRLGIMSKPSSGEWLEDEIAAWKKDGVHQVVSLLEPDEADKLGLTNVAYLCGKFSLQFAALPFPERGVPPSVEDTAALVQSLKAQLQSRKKVAIFCRTGMGRSALVAACVLCCFGHDAKKAFGFVSSARGFMVPDTPQQREWVEQFAALQAPA